MDAFAGRVAVITGAASGIGRSLADRCATEGMKLVLADVELAALERAAEEVRARGAEVLAVHTDVADPDQVERLAQRTDETFGGAHLLFNNAGVTWTGVLWEASLADWQWVLGVNLFGVFHGIRSFVPRMLRRGEEGHIVNTSSITGLLPAPSSAIYSASKNAVVALTESLFFELESARAPLGVSVLCPAWVRTRIADAARNRPAALSNPADKPVDPVIAAIERYKHGAVEKGSAPEEIADQVFAAIRAKRLYITPHPDWLNLVTERARVVVAGENPSMGLPPLELLQELVRIKKAERATRKT